MNYKTHLWLLLILISACSQPTPEEHIAKSQLLISENKSSEAIIELKKAIKLSPQASEIRLMLGEVYFEQADYVQAEKEMLKSLELGQSATQVVPLIAHLYTITKKPEDTLDIIERFNDAIEKSDNSELLFYKGYALMSIDQTSSATSTFSLAIDTNTSKFSNLSAAYLDWIAADKVSANTKIDDLIANNEDFAQAHMARAEFNIENNLEKTIIALERYLNLIPDNVYARLLLSYSYSKNGRYAEAEKIADNLLLLSDSHPYFNQLKGVSRYYADDLESAIEHLEKAIQNGQDTTSNRIIIGYSYYRLSRLESAYQNLRVVKNDIPQGHASLKLLAAVKLKLGYDAETTDTIVQLGDSNAVNLSFLNDAGYKMLFDGFKESAKKVVAKAQDYENKAPLDELKLGLLKLSLDDLSGIENIDNAIKNDPTLPNGRLLQIQTHLANNQIDMALDYTKLMIEEEPNNVIAYNQIASIYKKLNNPLKAEEALTQALQIDPTNESSLVYFINKEFKTGNREAAMQRMAAALKQKPTSISLLINNYVLQKTLNMNQVAFDAFDNALKTDENKVMTALTYARILFNEKEYVRTIDVLESNLTPQDNFPDEYWQYLSVSYFRTGDTKASIKALESWTKIKPDSALGWVEYLSLLDSAGRHDDVIRNADHALKNIPSHPLISLIKANNLAALDQLSTAERTIYALDVKFVEMPIFQGALGKIYTLQKDYDRSIPALNKFYLETSDNQSALYLFRSHLASGKDTQAISFMDAHLAKKEDDTIARELFAHYLMTTKSDDALTHYLKLLEVKKDNFVALNNTAWLYYEQNQLEKAKYYIERALQIKPDNANALNTDDKIDKAIESQKKS